MPKKPRRKPGKVVTKEDAVIEDSAARMSKCSRFIVCPECGLTYRSGLGHLGSDFCKVQVVKNTHLKAGFAPLSRTYRKMVTEAKIDHFEDRGGYSYDGRKFRTSKAEYRMYAPLWVEPVLLRCYRVRMIRRSTVALLKAFGKMDRETRDEFVVDGQQTELLVFLCKKLRAKEYEHKHKSLAVVDRWVERHINKTLEGARLVKVINAWRAREE